MCTAATSNTPFLLLETLRLQRRNGVHTMATAHASYVTRVKSGKNHVPSLGRVPRAGAPQALP